METPRDRSPALDTELADAAILVVDDHPPNLQAIEAVLEPLGYPIVLAGSGAEALRLIEARDFVLIIMDVHMPMMDGYETVERLRTMEMGRHVPIVFLTAVYDRPEHRRRGYDLGAIDFIEKPFETPVLRGKVRSIVSLYMRGRQIERARSLELDRIKDVFLGAVGHDLRTPLSSIVMASRLLGRDECSKSERRGHAMRVEMAARRMNRMIEDILDLTCGHFAGGIPVSRERTDLGAVTFAVVSELRLARPNRPVDLEVTGDLLGEWDSSRMARVISNLVDNAIQHCGSGPVRVTLAGDDDVVVLEVHNGGDVIPSELLSHLFEPFRRGVASDGVGLGLFIVREIVLAHGGTVDVASIAAEGTTFTVSVPRHPSEGMTERRTFSVARSALSETIDT